MPGMFWGSFASGLGQGLRQGMELKMAADEHKLKSKMLEQQAKRFEFEQQKQQADAMEAEQQRKAVSQLADLIGQGVEQQITPGFESEEQQMSVAPTTQRRPATEAETKAALIRATPTKQMHQITEKLIAPKGGSADMTEYQRQSLELARQRLATPREGVGVESQTWSRIVKENPGADVATLREIYNREVNKTAGTRAGGAESGRMDVRSTPRFQETERGVSQARAEGSTAGRPLGEAAQTQVAQLESLLSNTLPTIRKNYDPNYLGPIKGTDMAFEGRRRVGSSLGSPVGERETQFRLALADAGDILLRARSGAQINEQEYGRLKGILPRATDEPTVFNSALARFEAELRSILKQKVQVGRTPRGQLGGGGPAPAPSGKLRFNPQTGRIE